MVVCCLVSDTPSATPEGRLIRYRMGQAKPKLSDAKLAARLGWGRDKVNMAATGRTRTRRGKKDYHPSDADLVLIARELGITPEELERAGRPEAAQRLREEPHVRAVEADAPDFDRLFRALTAGRPDAETLWYLAHATDGEGRLRPFAERVDLVVNWLADRPARQAQDGLKAV